MNNSIKKEYIDFIQKQLSEMANKVKKNSSTNKPAEDLLNKTTKKLFDNRTKSVIKTSFVVKSDKITIEKVKREFEERDKKGNGIPIDLFVFEKTSDEKNIAYSYELKAGGNLDTKNAPSNAKEVKSLKTIFSFCDKSISRFVNVR